MLKKYNFSFCGEGSFLPRQICCVTLFLSKISLFFTRAESSLFKDDVSAVSITPYDSYNRFFIIYFLDTKCNRHLRVRLSVFRFIFPTDSWAVLLSHVEEKNSETQTIHFLRKKTANGFSRSSLINDWKIISWEIFSGNAFLLKLYIRMWNLNFLKVQKILIDFVATFMKTNFFSAQYPNFS